MPRTVILASTSPRRKALLSLWGIPYRAVSPSFEEVIDESVEPRTLVRRLARGKALSLARRYPRHLILAADTVIVYGRRLLGKPETPARAREMLRMIRGACVSSVSGFAIIDTASGKSYSGVEETLIYMRRYSHAEIDAYVRTKESLDLAGAFGVQGKGSLLIDRIEGDFYTVVGMPVRSVARVLPRFGVRVW